MITMLKKNSISKIKYTSKGKNETTERTIIPTYLPAPNMTALDISELSEDEQAEMLKQWEQYSKLRDDMIKSIISFDEWLTTKSKVKLKVKWRQFIKENIS